MVRVAWDTSLLKMLRAKLIEGVCHLKNARVLLEERCALPQVSFTSKYSMVPKKDAKNKSIKDDEDEDFDKPIKFSTSKAATFPAAYMTAAAENRPEWQGLVVSFSLIIFCIYFGMLREENDIDEKIVQNMPPEVIEQIYGKKERSKYT